MQPAYIGIDIGSISAKIAAVNEAGEVLFHAYRRTSGRPVETVFGLLDELHDLAPLVIAATGSGAGLFIEEARSRKHEAGNMKQENHASYFVPHASSLMSHASVFSTINEFKAIITAIGQLYPDVRTIFEMGGETSKFIRIEAGSRKQEAGFSCLMPHASSPIITEYGINGDCAAGTGSFIDQQANRLHYNVEDIGDIVSCAERCARVAGRCSVFAKSDMIHAQQKGYTPPEVLKGLCLAVARNFKATIVKGRHIVPKVAFVGGLALNGGVANAVREVFGLRDGEMIVPKEAAYLGAIGAALLAKEAGSTKQEARSRKIMSHASCPDGRTIFPKEKSFAASRILDPTNDFSKGKIMSDRDLMPRASSIGTSIHTDKRASLSPLSTQNVRFLRDRVRPYHFPRDCVVTPSPLMGEGWDGGENLKAGGQAQGERGIATQSPSQGKVDAYLGIDVGSVSTNFAVIDEAGDLIMEIYTYTKARPIEVVAYGLKEIEAAIGDRINIVGVGTTGSGRELIGELIGADVIKDEITAHKTGALHISEGLLGEPVDTIFEIGGQDSKFIRIEDGVVTDFAMNEACAAGTGSFLEEQAERLGINIKDQFAELALSSDSPIPLGERCTVFMERDVNAHQLKGMELDDIVAGLAYSVATNYLNRVVRGRNIGEHIFFQGGTAYNDAVAAAFSQILQKTITVPPYNGVIGAIGVALLARDSLAYEGRRTKDEGREKRDEGRETKDERRETSDERRVTRFRGFDIGRVNYTIREFNCGACTNNCDIQEFNVEGEKTHWGDKCSSRFRKKARTDNKPVIEDLVKLRSELLLRTEVGSSLTGVDASPDAGGTKQEAGNMKQEVVNHASCVVRRASSIGTSIHNDKQASVNKSSREVRSTTIGIPRSMFFYDRFPFWRAYFETLGCRIVVSDETNKVISHDSCELSVAEPCYPIKLVHGHVKNLMEKGVDYVWLPNMISGEKNEAGSTKHEAGYHVSCFMLRASCFVPHSSPIPYLCPWHQTIPFIIKAVPAFEPAKLLSPTIQFEHGKEFVTRCMEGTALALGASKRQNRTAVDAAYDAQADFNRRLQQLGAEALKMLASGDAQGVVLAGRPYNIYDTGANLNVPTKLREYYGINVIPMDFLPTDGIDIEDAASNMFWNYGRKIIAVAKFVSSHPNLHMIYITNFKCGPDSFIKHYTSWCSKDKPLDSPRRSPTAKSGLARGKPYLTLQFDEHANDAGIITRIEAYLESTGLLKSKFQITNSKLQISSNDQNHNDQKPSPAPSPSAYSPAL